MKNRSSLREIIVKVLYQIYIYEKGNVTYNVDELIKEHMIAENEFIKTSLIDIIERQKEIDALANKYLKDWNIDRLSKVDKAILSLGIYELMWTETPDIVCINEAIELSKIYSDEKVTKMINGVLDSIYHEEVSNE